MSKYVHTTASVLMFGKYKDKTVDEVLDSDPKWLIWADENVEFFELDKNAMRLAKQAAEDE